MVTLVMRYWRETLIFAVLTAVLMAAYDYGQLRQQMATMDRRYTEALNEVKRLDSIRVALTDSIKAAERRVQIATERWEDAKRRAKTTVVYVPRSELQGDTPTRIADPVPSDTSKGDGTLVAVPILEHPIVKDLVTSAERRIAAGDTLIAVLTQRVNVDSALIEQQRVIIQRLSIPPKSPNKFKKIITSIGLGAAGAFIGQKVKGTTGLVLGGLIGSVSASMF